MKKARPAFRLNPILAFGPVVLVASALLLGCPAPEYGTALPELEKVVVNDNEAQDVYVRFEEVDVKQLGGDTKTIWTRVYDTENEPKKAGEPIPGPTFYFKPGDLLQINLINLLSDANFKLLSEYDESVKENPSLDTDEIVHHYRDEINVPHNPNNTNLHTHGLHVDPSHDDVTLIVVPEAPEGTSDPEWWKVEYNENLWPYIKGSNWEYRYRIPDFHLPGTHWYHAHKHGSTSVHVENGMAGAFVIQPKDDEDSLYPWLKPDQDQVLILQEIANYGLQLGKGNRSGIVAQDLDSAGATEEGAEAPKTKGLSDHQKGQSLVTVNGAHLPTITMKKGEVRRWRFVNASANHHSFSQIWLGYDTGETVSKKLQLDTGEEITVEVPVYESVPMLLSAIDGVPLAKPVEVGVTDPIFMGPGNRADVFVTLPNDGSYSLFKGVPAAQTTKSQRAGQDLKNGIWIIGADGPTPQSSSINNPYFLVPEDDNGPSFVKMKVDWANFQNYHDEKCAEDPSDPPTAPEPNCAPATPMAPLLSVQPNDSGLLDVSYDTEFPSGRFAPIGDAGGGAVNPQRLFIVAASGDAASPVDGSELKAELSARLDRLSPAGAEGMKSAPSYVSPVTDGDILQSRTPVFDLTGIRVAVNYEGKSKQMVRQFTLNGRQFHLKDWIGNKEYAIGPGSRVSKPAMLDTETEKDIGDLGVTLTLDYLDSHLRFKNTHWTNPAYYLPIKNYGTAFAPVYNYDYIYGADPSYKDVTGLPDVSVRHEGYEGEADGDIPGLPVATSGEEWVLINNSDIGHPFHIHINPFFITEIGQLSYENEDWLLRTISTPEEATKRNALNKTPADDQKMAWMTGAWWDTIVIPPHGYVRMRYWMNVPEQSGGENTAPDEITFADNVSREASWVYHCHILRHEDRGMMMIVKTQCNANGDDCIRYNQPE